MIKRTNFNVLNNLVINAFLSSRVRILKVKDTQESDHSGPPTVT